jgi:hypothetical protein
MYVDCCTWGRKDVEVERRRERRKEGRAEWGRRRRRGWSRGRAGLM